MEGLVIDRLDHMSMKVREGVTVCQEILNRLEQGSPSTKGDEIKANRLQNHYNGFISEIQLFLQSHPSKKGLTENVQVKLRNYTALQLDASEVLSDLEVYLSPSSSQSINQAPSEGNSSRLPKLDMPKFDGNVLHWHAFWDKFTSKVAQTNLNDVDKFSYLEQALEGEAARAIGGLDTTNANYTIAVDRLKERFAKPGILKDSHYVALQQIPRASSDVAECRQVLDDIERHLQVLKSLGEDTNHTGLRSTILDKFPAEVLHDLRQYTKSDDESVDAIRGYLTQVISNREDFSRRESIKTMGHTSVSGFTTEAFFSRDAKSPNPQNTNRQQNAKTTQNPKQSRWNRRGNKQQSENSNQGQISNPGQKQTQGQKRPAFGDQSRQVSEPPAKKVKRSCFFCSKPHFSDTCRTHPTIEARKALLKNRCYQCLSNSHLSDKCQRKMNCRHCGQYGVHNRALCPTIEQKVGTPWPTLEQKVPCSSTTVNFAQIPNGAILQTARAPIFGSVSLILSGRILFDTGSERSYISQRLMRRLKLTPVEQTSLTIYTFGCKRPKSIPTALVQFGIQTRHDRVDVSAYAVPITTNDIPSYPDLKHSIQEFLPSIHIAEDVDASSPADIIIGNDFYHKFVRAERKEVKPNLFLINSSLGWILSGALPTSQDLRNSDHQLSFLTYIDGGCGKHPTAPTPPDLPFQHDGIRGLWEVEAIGITDSPKVLQDEQIVQFFNRTTVIKDGRYFVKWPWVQYPPDLPVNYGLSHGRLKSLLKRLDTSTLHRYNAVFQDQLDKGVIEVIQESSLPTTHPVHYLPHHCVIQEHKSTKLRVVYDASAKVQGQCSLNEYLYKGPLMLEDLATLLLNFRTNQVALTADIEKAFLQVGLQDDDRDVTRFLWLKDLSKPPTTDNLLHFRFCRVPFGIVSSPYLLAATIRLHLQRHSSPLTERISKCLYVDNLITGAESEDNAFKLYQEARNRFNELSMNIREWCSNKPGMLKLIPQEQQSKETSSTVLGLKWDQASDQLSLSVKQELFQEPVNTKRQVSHVVASVFDPCGLVIPLTLESKLFLQNLWTDKLKWDTPLPEHKLNEWKHCVEHLEHTPQVALPRLYWCSLMAAQPDSPTDFQLHCFSDASKEAYAAAVYVRASSGSNCVVSLVMARLRLTPVRCRDSWTIPKLELMAVLIGSRLLSYVKKAIAIPFSQVMLWTDSQVVLGWLKSDRLLPPFVTRRLTEIRQSTNEQFRYVPSLLNPADIATRRLKEPDIPPMWFHGPDFLKLEPIAWPSQYLVKIDGSILQDVAQTIGKRDSTQTHVTMTSTADIQDPPGVSLPEHGTTLPLETIRSLQRTFFPEESARKSTTLAKTMGLFIDDQGLLRCKGRFQHAELTHDQKYPILLPKGSQITAQLILRIHEQNHHVGVTHTLSLLRQLYWVPQGRGLVKSVLATCPPCIRYGGGPYQLPCMPDLPANRVSYSSPFTFTGLDYIGPLSVTSNGMKRKRWICLFTCMAVRAVHLEVVDDMTADEFALALRRFVAARGTPSLIVSDNAAQFKATAAVLNSPTVGDSRIHWKFIPELSPWQGGFYERLVGLVKHCLRRSLDRILLRDNQLLTVVKEIESVLNTRPLTVIGDDLSHVLTPSDFLRPSGPPLLEPPSSHQSASEIQSRLVDGWKRTQRMLGEFRRMFVNQYLVGLRERLQFHHDQPRVVNRSNPTVGDVVLVKGDSTNRAHWKVARIQALLPSRDGLVRSARVLLPTGGELTRSIGHLYPLEVSPGTTPVATTPSAPPQPLSQHPPQMQSVGTRSPDLPSTPSEILTPPTSSAAQAAQQTDFPTMRPRRASAHQALRRIRQWTRGLFVAAVAAHH